MKKRIIIIVTIILIIIGLLTGFLIEKNKHKVTKTTISKEKTEIKTKETEPITTGNKTLVVYFSKSGGNYGVGNVEIGNTALMATYIKDYLNADIYEIIPEEPYPDDYKSTTERAQKEQQENARPKIKNKIDNLNEYKTIFIGYPIWHSDLPMIIYTFLETNNLNNKIIIPFNTHEGSGNAGTYQKIKEKVKRATVNTKGLAIQGVVARTEEGKNRTISWLKELGY